MQLGDPFAYEAEDALFAAYREGVRPIGDGTVPGSALRPHVPAPQADLEKPGRRLAVLDSLTSRAYHPLNAEEGRNHDIYQRNL